MLQTLLAVVLVSLLLLVGLLLRMLWFRAARHNVAWCRALAEQQQADWVVQHRQTLALQEIVLVGAAAEGGSWQALLERRSPLPRRQQEVDGEALRMPQVAQENGPAREVDLARLLAMQWAQQRQADSPVPDRCYWLGSAEAWQAFADRAALSLPGLVLPARPLAWQGEQTLSSAIAWLADAQGETLLIAGCQSQPATSNARLPAGEAAVLWLAGHRGALRLPRGEVTHPGEAETLTPLCQRAQLQSQLTAPPQACVLFSLPPGAAPFDSGWNLTHHLQDSYWGDTGRIEALVVMSLAALNAQYQATPTGWIARDPSGGYTTGVVQFHG